MVLILYCASAASASTVHLQHAAGRVLAQLAAAQLVG